MTGLFVRDDFMNVKEIAAEFNVDGQTIRRWIQKYAEPASVQVHRGQYYVTKEAVQVWKNALDGRQPMKGKRLPALEGFRGIYTSEALEDADRE